MPLCQIHYDYPTVKVIIIGTTIPRAHEQTRRETGVSRARARATHALLPVDLDPEELVRQGVDDDQNVRKLGLEDGPPVVPPVVAPHNVHLVVAQVTHLRKENGGQKE